MSDLITQKKADSESEIRNILNAINMPADQTTVEEEVELLITKKESSSISENDFKLKLKSLGVNEEDISLWMQNEVKLKKEKSSNTIVSPLTACKHIDKILYLKDQLLTVLPDYFYQPRNLPFNYDSKQVLQDEFGRDKLLELSCEYLISKARPIIRSLQSFLSGNIQNMLPKDPIYSNLDAVQEGLEALIKTSNRKLHMHELAVPTSWTPEGRRWLDTTYLWGLFNAIQAGPVAVMPSFFGRLAILKFDLLTIMGLKEYEMQNFASAKEHFEESLQVCDKLYENFYNPFHVTASFHSLGDIHEKLDDYPKALEYYNQAFSLLNNTTTPMRGETFIKLMNKTVLRIKEIESKVLL